MRILIAPDSFKGCLTAESAARAIAEGVRKAAPAAELILVPMADGGEGTVSAMVQATDGRKVTLSVQNPLGKTVPATYGILGKGRAVIEMAAASGLSLIGEEEATPFITTTYGTGQLIRHALDQGAKHIIIGLGGSATNDCGAGMAQALGFSLVDQKGKEISPGGGSLKNLATIDRSRCHPALASCEIMAACDVDNLLCGPHGATAVYGPQKGVKPSQIKELDAGLHHFAKILEKEFGKPILDLPGGGAAGGLGAGLVAFTGAKLQNGFDLVAKACDLAGRLFGADLAITGEGRLDGQSIRGKVPVGVAHLAREKGIPVVVLAGSLEPGYQSLYKEGVTAAFSICPGPTSLRDSLAQADHYLAATAESIVRIWMKQA